MRTNIETASWIRAMFEEGRRLKQKFGEDNVYDFTLGNPSAPTSPRLRQAMIDVATRSKSSDHRYMTNIGLEDTRRFIASMVAPQHGLPITERQVVMTTGAAGALNIVFKSVLDVGDEVIVLAPYFPEYLFYVTNHGGRPVVVKTLDDFQPDVDAILAAVTSKTRAVIINTPNNPTGVCYDQSQIDALGRGLEQRAQNGRAIYLILDEPYRRVRYSDRAHPSVLSASKHAIVATSFSKDLGLAGERIGYLVLHPELPGLDEMIAALAISIRILGFVNAPAFMQRVITLCADDTVDFSSYARNREAFIRALEASNYDFVRPDGAFFLFPKAPGGNDVEFCRWLTRHNVLCVPGRGFGASGYFRISYAVGEDIVQRALPIFESAARAFRSGSHAPADSADA